MSRGDSILQRKDSLLLKSSCSIEKVDRAFLSTSFKIPSENIKLEKSLIDAHIELSESRTEIEKEACQAKIDNSSNMAENQAILEVNLAHPLLEENVEILIHSEHMSETIFNSLLLEKIPIYLYGITSEQLNQKVIMI